MKHERCFFSPIWRALRPQNVLIANEHVTSPGCFTCLRHRAGTDTPSRRKPLGVQGAFSSVNCWDWTGAFALPRLPEPYWRIRRDGPRLDLPGAGAQRPQAAVTSRLELPHKSLCIWLDQPPFPCNLTVSLAVAVSQEPAIRSSPALMSPRGAMVLCEKFCEMSAHIADQSISCRLRCVRFRFSGPGSHRPMQPVHFRQRPTGSFSAPRPHSPMQNPHAAAC